MNYTPIAEKSLGTNQEHGLEMRLVVFSIIINAKIPLIEVFYDIVLMSPKGKIVSVLTEGRYHRSNQEETETEEENMKFNALRESSLGKGIQQLIQSDINQIQSFETIADDLKQAINLK